MTIQKEKFLVSCYKSKIEISATIIYPQFTTKMAANGCFSFCVVCKGLIGGVDRFRKQPKKGRRHTISDRETESVL